MNLEDDTPFDTPAERQAVELGLPPLPPIGLQYSIGYAHIRYVPGYPEEFVKQYAVAYAREALRNANR